MIIVKEINSKFDMEELASYLLPFFHSDFYLVLEGELGSGKTTLVKFIARKLGISERLVSPSFNICKSYKLEKSKLRIYFLNHFDFFRLKEEDDLSLLKDLALGNLNIIEWGSKNPCFWTNEDFIILRIFRRKKRDCRRVIMSSHSFRNFFLPSS